MWLKSKTEKGTHKEEHSNAEEAWVDGGHDLVHALAQFLSKPEQQLYWDEESTDDSDGRAFLWLQLTLVIILGVLDEIQVHKEGEHENEHASKRPRNDRPRSCSSQW